METTFTFRKSFSHFVFTVLAVFFAVFGMTGKGYGQTKSYATWTPSAEKLTPIGLSLLPGDGGVTNKNNAAIPTESEFATVMADRVAALGIVVRGSDAALELKFPTSRPAGTTTLIRISQPALNAANVSLGDILGLAGSSITAEIYSGASDSDDGVGTKIDTEVLTKMLVDGSGNYYLAVTPNGLNQYNAVKLIFRFPDGLVQIGQFTMNVYNAFSIDDVTCGVANFASVGETTGITASLTDVVQNPQRAIDADTSSFSVLTAGTLGVGNSVFQSFYFNGLSGQQDYFKIKLAIGGGALNLSLLGNYEVRAYNGNTLVYSKKLQGGLINGLDLLSLLQNGNPVTIPFGPGVPFDRVSIGISAIANVGLADSPLRIYHVERYGSAGSTLTCVDPNPPFTGGNEHMLGNNRACANTVISYEHADFPFNAADGGTNSYTTLEASSGLAANLGAYSGHIELGLGAPIPADTTVYVRIDFDNEVLGALLDGTLGGLLNDVVGSTLFGNHYFTVEAKNGATSVLTRSSNEAFSENGLSAQGQGKVKIVQDKYGHYYIALTSNTAFSSIRITERLSSLLGVGTVKHMNVYHACYSTGFEPCEQAFATYTASNGISLDLLGVGNAGVSNAQNAIDGDVNTASSISIGAAGIAASVYQYVDFHGLSAETDHFRVKLRMDGGSALSAEVLGSIVVKAFNGDQEVFSQRLRDGLVSDLDLLDLLQGGQVLSLPFGPGRPFDRVAVGIESLLSANVINNPLQVFSIERFSAACPDPELQDPPVTTPPFNNQDCGTTVTSFENTNFPLNTIDGKNDTYATLYAGTGTALGLGAFSSHIELAYPNAIPAKETSYIRIDFEDDMLNSLLGGSLGGALADLAGGLLLGNHYFEVMLKDANGNQIYNASSVDGFSDQAVKVVKDANGRFYIAVTADVPYQSVRITHGLAALIGGNNTATMNVYSMCRETEFNPCEQATFTSFDGSGLTLDLLDISKGGIFNSQYAIDENSSNYSTINLGVAGVGATVYQNIYFKTKSAATDSLRLRVQLDQPGILNVDLAGSYRIKLFNGDDEVYNQPLQSSLINNLDLLGLLNTGGIIQLTIAPGVVYDRVQFGLQSVASINTSAPLRFYGVSRISENCPDPDFLEPPYRNPVCADDLVSAEHTDDLQNLFDGNHNSYATIRSDAGVTKYSGHVEFGYAAPVAAGTTSYIRIDTEGGLLDALLAGSVGKVLTDILNNVVLGNHYFHVYVKDASGATVVSGSSEDSFTGSTTGMNPNKQIRVVQDNAGRYYLAITPNTAYQSVRIEDHTDALLLGQNNSMNVYGMCYETDFEGCAEAFTTSFDGSGLTAGLTGIGNYGVQNPYRVLDNNNNGDYSEISLGALSVAGAIQQNVQFNKEIEANSIFKIKMAVGTGTLDAGVFGRIDVVGYNNGQEVYVETLENAVVGNVNLLQLFNNGASPEISVSPDVAVDELAIRLRSLVGVTVVPNVRLYYIQQDCDAVSDFVAWKSYAVNADPSIASVKGGEEVTYTIHIRNTGTVDLAGLSVTDTIPAHTTYVDGSGGVLAGNAVTFENVAVAAGATTTLSFKVTVNADLTDVTQISNTAFVKTDANDPGKPTYPPANNATPTDPDTSGPTGTNIPVDQISSLVSWKAYKVNGDASITSVSGGEEIEYTIYVRNTGNQALTNVNITDPIPTGTEYVSGGTSANSAVSFTIPTLAVGETSSPQVFTVKVKANLTGLTEIRNVAAVTSNEVGTPTESFPPVDNTNPTEPNDTGGTGTVIPVAPADNLVSWKAYKVNGSADSTAVRGGETVEYAIYVRNNGNQDLTNVVISDVLPAGLTYVSGGSLAGNTVTFTIPSLAAGQTSTPQIFTVKVNEDLTGIDVIRNLATVVSDELTTPIESFPPVDNTTPSEPDTTGTTGTPLDVTPLHDLDLALTGTSDGANSGRAVSNDVITYTVTVTNNGNKALTNVNLVDAIPQNTTLESAGDFTQNGNNLELTIPTLTVGETQTYTFTVRVNTIDPTVVTSIDNSVTATYRNEDNTADKSETATHSMPTDCTPIDASNITLAGAENPICAGEEITLTAAFSGLTTPPSAGSVKWYTTADLSGTPLTGLSITVNPEVNTTYYVVVEGDGFCFNNPPAQISVTVSAMPETPTITATGANPFCEGGFTTLVASGNADSYKWFNNGVEITGQTSANLEVSTAGQYTVIALNAGGCESSVSASFAVQMNPRPAQPTVQLDGDAAICSGTEVTLTSSATAGNQWFKDGVEIQGATQQTLTVNEAGTYTVIVTDPNTGCTSLASTDLVITVNPTPEITINGNAAISAKVGEAVQIPGVTTDPTGLTPTWYDNDGNVTTNLNPTFSTPGVYTYTAVVTNGGCSASATVVITVYDENACPPLVERVYANTQTWSAVLTGDVENPTNAVDGNPQTHATLRTLLGVAGIGSVRQNLLFAQEVEAGTPVSVKFGKELSAVGLISGVSVVGLDADGNEIGRPQNVQGGLLDLLVGDNVAEFTFVPADNSGPKNYKGVRVIQAAVLSVAQNTRVYGAYVTQNSTTNNCAPVVPGVKANVIDVLHGVRDIGLGALSATSSVSNAWNAVDNDTTSFATISRAAAVLNEAFLTVAFKTQSQLNDSIRIVTEVPNDPILQLELLKGYTIQRYLGETPVGEPLDEDSGLLNLKLLGLLGSSQRAAIIVAPTNEPFDRVRISYGSVASVLGNTTNIYDINLKPTISPVVDPDGELKLCLGDSIELNKVDDCTVYKIFDAAEGGNELTTSDGFRFALPDGLAAGEHTFYVQAVRQGCEVGARIAITVTIKPTAVEADINNILVNGAELTAPLCLEPNEEVVLTASLSATSTVVNPVFHWYNEAGAAVSGGENGTLNLGVLAAGTYTYQVGVSGDNVCESLPADRKSVTFVINKQAVDTDINVIGEGAHCFGSPVVLTPSASDANVTNPIFKWYSTADKSVEIVNGTVAGITYAIDAATGVLTITGLPINATPYTFYVTMSADGYCENESGRAVDVTVSSELDAPTFDTTNLLVCEGENASFTLTNSQPSITYHFYDANGVEITDPALISHDATTNAVVIHNVTASVSYLVESRDAGGCISGERTTITAGVKPVFTEPITVTINGQTPSTGICTDPAGNVVLAATVDAAITLTNPVFHWYDGAGAAVTGGEDGTLELVLTPGTYTYTVGVSSDEYCETPAADRTSVTFTINRKGVPGDIDIATYPTDLCAGEEVTFTASSTTVTNPIFRWYTTADLSDTPVEGASFMPTTLATGVNTFYVTVSGDDVCEGDASAAVSVTINVNATVEAPRVQTEVTVSVGQSIDITAALGETQTGDPADYEIVWTYDNNGTPAEFIGATFTVPNDLPVGVKTYEVSVRSKVGALCESPKVTVTVNVTEVINDDCLEANAQTNGTNGICLLCGVSDAGNAVDGNPETYAVLQRTVNVLGKVWQELIFPNGGKQGDTVSVWLSGNNSILDASILGGLNIGTYNGATNNNDGSQTGAILDITLFPGSTTIQQFKFIAGADFDRVRIEQYEAVGLLANGLRIHGANLELPAPTDIQPVDGTAYCQGDEITLSATAAPNTQLRWFDDEGNLIGEGATVTTTAPTDKTGEVIYEVVAFRTNTGGEICYGERIPVKLVINDKPEITEQPANLTLAPGSTATFNVVATGTGLTYQWEQLEGTTWTALPGETNSSLSLTVPLVPAGTVYTYRVVVSSTTGCDVISAQATLTVTAQEVDFTKSNLAVTKDGAIADGVDHNEVTATLLDAFDNPVANKDVVFTIVNVDGTTRDTTITTDANGKALATITSIKAGEASVTATVDGTAITVGSPAIVTFVAGPVDHDKSRLEVTKDGAVADGVDYNEATATIVDANDNPIAGQDVVFDITNVDGTTSQQTVTTDAAGKAIVRVTSTKAGEATIAATVGGTAISGSPVTVTFVAGPVDHDKSRLEVTKDGAVADGVDYNEATATIVDANDNPIAGQDVVFDITNVDGTTSQQTVTTDAAGKAIVRVTSTKAGEATIAATVGGTAISGSPVTVTFVAGPVDHDKSRLEVTKDGAVADGVDYNEATATIVDANDNPIAGQDVVFDITNVDGTTSQQTVTTDAAGKAIVRVNSTKAGEATIAATVGGTAISGSPVTVTFVAGPVDHDKSRLEVTKDGAVADGVDYNEATATIVDANDNPIAGQDVVFDITNVDGTTSQQTVTTDAAGKAIVRVTSTKAGEATIAATVGGTAISGSPVTVTFVAGPVDHDKSRLEVTKDGAVADGVDYNEATATIVDANDNPIAGQDVVFDITNVDGTTSQQTVTTDAAGKAIVRVTSTKAGEATIAATVGGTAISGSPATVTFVAGPVDHDKSRLEVTKDGAIADGVDYNEATATIVDANDNPIAGQDVVFDITNVDGTTSQQTVTTDAAGKAIVRVTSTKAGEATIAATVGGTSISGSPVTVTFVAGPVDHDKSRLEVTKDGAVADGVDYNEATATIVDANDNPIAGQDVVFDITNVDGTTSQQTVTTDAAGKAVVRVTSTKVGQATIAATVNGTAINGSPVTVNFVVNPTDTGKSKLEVTKDGAVADGVDYNEATATIVDAFENPIANKDVVFDITNVDGTTSQQTVTTDAAGKAVVRITSTSAGQATIAATVDRMGISGSPVVVNFVRPYNLSITKVADQARVKAGESTTFTVTITNEGPTAIPSGKVISLTERPGNGVSITGYEVTSGNGTINGTGNTPTVTTSANIPVNGTIVVKVTAQIAVDAPATITNGISVWGPDKPITEDPDDEDDTPEIPVDRDAQLSITKVADQARVVAGTSTSFTVTITNNGPAEIASGKVITLTERPGSGVSITGYEVTSGNGTASGNATAATVTTNKVIPVNGTIIIKVTATVATDAPATITNGISVWGPDKPTTEEPDDEDDTPEIPVDYVSNLSITKVADQARVQAGESTSFTVTITNNGPSDILSGKVINIAELPSEGLSITGYEVTSGNGTASGNGNTATVIANTKVARGGTITMKITGLVNAEAPAVISNGIQVWGPDKPVTQDPDDEDQTPEIPVDYQLPEAADDEAETTSATPVTINVLANDRATRWPLNVASVEIVNAPQNGKVAVNADGTVTYTSDKGYVGTDRFTYTVKDEKGNVSNAATVMVNVIPNPLFIPNAFTPNGDGKNDQFEIMGIEGYDRVELYVFNRWGNEVYNNPNYNNNWDGQNLNEGTYYYLIKLIKEDKVETQKGWVLLKRQ
uniref:Conserved repeat domain protein n=1 Tax=Sphingobacterium sp. (strain 21) TaxID=743722 RepID=F4CBQ7_SPHS2